MFIFSFSLNIGFFFLDGKIITNNGGGKITINREGKKTIMGKNRENGNKIRKKRTRKRMRKKKHE